LQERKGAAPQQKVVKAMDLNPLLAKINRSLAGHRDVPVKCAACGRSVLRQSRQQKFCSDRCRDFARREKNGRTAIKKSIVGQDTRKPTNPPKTLTDSMACGQGNRGRASRIYGPRHVIERELIAGRDWSPVVSPDGVRCMVAPLRRTRSKQNIGGQI
jgi:endogenous inhibitor of DNA gyrase (YacG/DUF329 family)